MADGGAIVDAHFHLWDLKENFYPWLSGPDRPSLVNNYTARLRHDYLVGDLLADFGDLNVVAGVHVQAEHDPADPVRETRWLQAAADRPGSRGFPHGIVADVDFADPDAEAILERHCAHPNMRGIRHAVHRRLAAPEPYDPLEDPAWTGRFPLLRKFGLSFDLQAFPVQQEGAARLITANPDVQFIVTHCGLPLWRDDERMALWRSAVRAYAAFPNAAIKISGFGSHSPDWTGDGIRPIVDHVIACFTPARCILASNYPVERLFKPYAEVWATYRRLFAGLSADERDGLFRRNAAKLYRLDLEAIAATY